MEALFPPGTDLSQIPSQAPPDGVTPNFVDPPSLAALPKVFIYATLPPMVLFLGLRFYTRIKISRKVGIDDYLCALAAAVMIAYCGVMLTFLDNPAGRHMWDIPLSMITVHYVSRSTILTGVYMIAAMLIKASILLLYKRLFHISMRANVMIWIGLFVNVVFYLVCFGVFMADCVPHKEDEEGGGWLSRSYDVRCTKISGPIASGTGIVGSIIDIFILIIPIVIVSGLRASWRKKAGIFAVFIAGSSACVFSIVGTVYRVMLSSSPSADITWTSMPVYAMNVGEVNVGIMSATMPVIFVLFKGFTRASLTWISKLRYMTRGKTSDPSGKNSEGHVAAAAAVDSEKGHGHGHDGMPMKLPQVPKGTLSGLRSWMRNKNRTTPVPVTATYATTDTEAMLTYVSADYDYHRQLKTGVVTAASGPAASATGTPRYAGSVWTGETMGTPPHSSRGGALGGWN